MQVDNIHAIFCILICILQYNFVFSEPCTTGFIENKLSYNKYFCCSHICEDKQSTRYNLAWCCQSVCRANYQDICQNIYLSKKPVLSKRFLDKPVQSSTGTDKLTTNPTNQKNRKLVFSKLFWIKTSLATSTEPTKRSLEKQSDNETNSKLWNLYLFTFILLVSVAILIIFLFKSWLTQPFKNQKAIDDDLKRLYPNEA